MYIMCMYLHINIHTHTHTYVSIIEQKVKDGCLLVSSGVPTHHCHVSLTVTPLVSSLLPAAMLSRYSVVSESDRWYNRYVAMLYAVTITCSMSLCNSFITILGFTEDYKSIDSSGSKQMCTIQSSTKSSAYDKCKLTVCYANCVTTHFQYYDIIL